MPIPTRLFRKSRLTCVPEVCARVASILPLAVPQRRPVQTVVVIPVATLAATPVETRAVILVATLVATLVAILAVTTVEPTANVTGTVPCTPPARPQPVAGAGKRIAAVSATAPVTARTVQAELSVTNLLKGRA